MNPALASDGFEESKRKLNAVFTPNEQRKPMTGYNKAMASAAPIAKTNNEWGKYYRQQQQQQEEMVGGEVGSSSFDNRIKSTNFETTKRTTSEGT